MHKDFEKFFVRLRLGSAWH